MNKFPRIYGMVVAEWVKNTTAPFVTNFSVVGSLRREEPYVKDVDVLVEVKQPIGENIYKIKNAILEHATWNRGGDRMMVFDDVFGDPIQLDLFLAHPPTNFFALLALRTGPEEDSMALRRGLVEHGLQRPHATLPVNSEVEMYLLAGMEYVTPERR